MTAPCPICDTPLRASEANPGGRDATGYSCLRCGDFILTGTLVQTITSLRSTDSEASAKLSHMIRRAQEQGNPVNLNSQTAQAALNHPLPRPREQADLLIRWLAKNVPGPGETVDVEFNTHGSIVGAKSPAGFELLLDHLFLTGLVTGNQLKTLQGGDRAKVTLTFKGWDLYDQLRQGGAVYRKGFMAMKFGDENLNLVVEKTFKPSAMRAGFDLVKLDDVPKAGLIDDRLRVEIQASDFVIADLTHDNLGAYWEAGYAEGLGKPVIYTCEKSKFQTAKTHFDTNHHLTILWDLAELETAGNKLIATIRATLPHLARLVDNEL